MHKSCRGMLVLLAIVVGISACVAQEKDKKPLSPAGEASVKFDDGKTVTIQYSRPSMRNRKVFGGLVPYDQVWRTGANAATSLKTDVDLTIGGATVPAGSYTLYSLPGANSWKLIINKQTGQWGTEYSQGQDLARVDMKVSKLPSAMETFAISLDKTGGTSAMLKLQWEDTAASVDIQEKK